MRAAFGRPLRRQHMSNVVIHAAHGKAGRNCIKRPESLNALNNEVVDGMAAFVDKRKPAFRRR